MKDNGGFTVKEFLGVANSKTKHHIGDFLGLRNDFAYQVISAVGNYNEIYQRHLSDLIHDQGRNALREDGGLLVSPPFTTDMS